VTVYVDKLRSVPTGPHWKWPEACHMIADSVDELHLFARRIGMRRSWFQPVSFPHYDLHARRRARAVHAGAVEVDRRGLVAIMRRARAAANRTP